MQTQGSNFQQLETAPCEVIQNWLIQQLAKQLTLDPQSIKIAEPLTRYGLDSIDSVTLVGDLEDYLDLELPSTLFWDYPTIEKSAQYLVENYDINVSQVEQQPAPIKEEKVTTNTEAKNKGWGKLWGK